MHIPPYFRLVSRPIPGRSYPMVLALKGGTIQFEALTTPHNAISVSPMCWFYIDSLEAHPLRVDETT